MDGCSNFRTFVFYRKKKKRYDMGNEKMIPFLLLSAIDFINFSSKKKREKKSLNSNVDSFDSFKRR